MQNARLLGPCFRNILFWSYASDKMSATCWPAHVYLILVTCAPGTWGVGLTVNHTIPWYERMISSAANIFPDHQRVCCLFIYFTKHMCTWHPGWAPQWYGVLYASDHHLLLQWQVPGVGTGHHGDVGRLYLLHHHLLAPWQAINAICSTCHSYVFCKYMKYM